MKRTASEDDEANPEMGLQFNPPQDAGNDRSTNDPAMMPDGESQEIMVGTAGKAILLGTDGDEDIDIESDSGERNPAVIAQSKSGVCPSWLQSSSPKMKGMLGLIAILMLGFVAVMVVGVVQLSAPSDDGNGDGASGVQSGQNTAIDLTDSSIEAAPVTPAPTPKPSPATASSSARKTLSPTQEVMIIPITNSKVNVVLTSFLENIVPDLSSDNALDITNEEQNNWSRIERILEKTISTSLKDNGLPTDYSLGSVQVEKFDGYDVTNYNIRRMRHTQSFEGIRHLQDDNGSESETIYSVEYSSSVTVNCLVSDCIAAPDNVASITSDLSDMEFIRVSADMEGATAPIMTMTPPTPETPVTPVTPPVTPVVVTTDKPTNSPVASTPAPITPSPVMSTGEPTTLSPTPEPTPVPTPNPTPDPTPEPTPEPTIFSIPILDEREDDCNDYTPCEKCLGECSDNDECEEGLLCFLRRGYEFVPGCEGPGRPGQNYCYDPFADGLTEDNLLSMEEADCDKKDQCGKCKGDCDEDEDCEKNLFCYRRSEFETVPGCAGQGNSGTDYCFDPSDIQGLGDF